MISFPLNYLKIAQLGDLLRSLRLSVRYYSNVAQHHNNLLLRVSACAIANTQTLLLDVDHPKTAD
ncbi:hypothetical protein [Argonema antarcticum]|uniref:hypothetical protein n=1 Tax=Argonema antarcticum TaxID=2942763 RepID=UPI00201319E1|nr:hypothetical protein [Argonema antarcticum]MCL1471615.1 hypothetical protein [Argonema antarcticum A004/B2]